jgi:uncharacterized protein (UPF0276 family)
MITQLPNEAGIGLRFPHHRAAKQRQSSIAWLEVHPENYMGGGAAPALLEQFRRDTPISFHGVGLSIGSAEGLDRAHLDRLAALVHRIEPAQISEHLAWSVADGIYLGDLLPLPLTEEALAVAARNVDRMQAHLGRQVLIENPSTYLTWAHTTISEPAFLAELAARTGCLLLCDVNNIAVSAHNHGFDARDYLRALPPWAVGEIHIAGHSIVPLPEGGSIRLDDHGSPVSAEVWGLLETALALFGPRPVLLEWDTGIPPLETLLAEAGRAQTYLDQAGCHARAA